jgi:hypothetical protein
MKTVKQTSLRILIVATLFTSSVALAQESKPDSEVAKPETEALVQINAISDSLIQELRVQLSNNIKNQVNMALVHSAELIKNSLSQ